MGEISVWVKGHPKQIGGVSHKTTAVEIVSFVLSECVWSTTEKARRSGRCYALFENWRGCQRLIPPGKRIYKLWKLWGLERIHVKFVVKKVAMETLARKDFGEYVEASQLKVPKRHVALRMEPHAVGGDDSEHTSSSDGVGLYLLNESVADGGQSPATRRKRTLLKQVVRQSEQLQGISRTVEDMDEEILFYEAKLHHYRLLEGGKDYVQDAYLAERDKNGLQNQDSSHSCGTIQEDVTSISKEVREQNVKYDHQTDERTLNSIGRENVAEHINIEENSRKKHGHSEVVLGKKNGTKVLVVNPLPRDHTTTSQTPDQTEHEISKTESVSHHHHTDDARKESPVYEGTTPSFRSTKRQHKHGGRVKKRLPGLYEFEQSCEWLKVMDKELKRLESMENLSFVDWDSESLLSDKDLKCRGNRKFKFRNAFANRNRQVKTSGMVNTNSSMKMDELNIRTSDLQLEHKLCLTSADCANENTMPEAKVIETWVDGNMETKDGPQPISERFDLTSTQVTRSDGRLSADSNTSHAAGISELMKGTLVCSPECKLKEKGMRCQLVSKEKSSSPPEREEGKKETFDNSKPANTSKPETIEKKCPKDDAKRLSYMPTSRQSLPQPILAPIMNNSNANTAPRARLQMSSPEASNLKQNDRSGSNFPLQSTKRNPSKVHSMNVLTNGERSEESHRTKSNDQPVSRNPPVVLSERVVNNKQCDENNEIVAVHSITAAKCGNKKVSGRPVPEPQSSPVSVRRVPKPPIYYPTEDSGPVRHSPTEPNQVLSRSSLNNTHCIQRHGVACSTGMAPKSYCSTALHPRVEQLRSWKLNGHVLSSTIKVSLEKETGESNNLPQNLKSAISKKKVESDVSNGQGIGKIGRKVYFKDEQEMPIREPVHSTPIKSKTLNPSTSRVRSPDQGLGQEILSPVEKGKSAENVDSGSDTGLSSVHSQDSGISNASVVIETWV